MERLHLGKLPAAPKPTDFKLAKFFDHEAALAQARIPFGFGKALPWQMFGNGPDSTVRPGFQGCGDCVWAGAAEETRIDNFERHGHDVVFTGKEVVSDYSAATGYVIGDDSTDYGTDMGQAADYRRKTGVVDASGKRHKIVAYARLEPGNFDQLLAATYTFGRTGIGIIFPDSAWDQFDAPTPVWDYVPGSPSDGGHYIPGVGSTLKDAISVVSWAKRVVMTRRFVEEQVDEAMAYFSDEQMRPDGMTLHGFSRDAMLAALAAL